MEPTLDREIIGQPQTKKPDAAQEPAGRWVPLLEFAHAKSVSLSTLRRYIKANKIQFKLDRGRYFIFDTDPVPAPKVGSLNGTTPTTPNGTGATVAAFEELKRLQLELQQARKEIAELKMLVAFYEDKYTHGPSA